MQQTSSTPYPAPLEWAEVFGLAPDPSPQAPPNFTPLPSPTGGWTDRDPSRIKVTPGYFVAYAERPPRSSDPDRTEKAREALREHGHGGKVTPAIASRMRKIVSRWIQVHKAQAGKTFEPDKVVGSAFTFATLTLPSDQQHPDQFLTRHCLGHLLTTLRRGYPNREFLYLWRAERQKNGRIHYHILLDRYVDAMELRGIWNHVIAPYGYIKPYQEERTHFYRNGFRLDPRLAGKVDEATQRKRWEYGVKTNWTNPNSTDIKKLEKVENVAAYIGKYLSKNEAEDPIKGRIWGCADGLRNLKDFECYEGDFEELQELQGPETRRIEEVTEVRIQVGPMLEIMRQRGGGLAKAYKAHWIQQARQLYSRRTGDPPPLHL